MKLVSTWISSMCGKTLHILHLISEKLHLFHMAGSVKWKFGFKGTCIEVNSLKKKLNYCFNHFYALYSSCNQHIKHFNNYCCNFALIMLNIFLLSIYNVHVWHVCVKGKNLSLLIKSLYYVHTKIKHKWNYNFCVFGQDTFIQI